MLLTLPGQPGLPRALASLLAQTHEDWEALVTIDGACPRTEAWVEALQDPRVRCLSLKRRRGRGAARQTALMASRGAWIGFLDADDWYTPDKLALQWRRLQEEPTLDLLSTPLFITDATGQLRGVREQDRQGTCRPGAPLPELPFAPSLIRRELALRAGFRASFRSSEDRDFFARLLPGCCWAVLDRPAYVYDEYGQHSVGRTLRSGLNRMRLVRQQGGERLARLAAFGTQGARLSAQLLAHAVGAGEWLVRRRSALPSSEDELRFAWARLEVETRQARLPVR